MSIKVFAFVVAIAMPITCTAQQFKNDVADQAIAAAFGRDNRVLLCLDQGATHRDIRAKLDPLISGVDPSKEEAFRPILSVIYANFPCPFSPFRPELERASQSEMVGRWVFPQASMALRYGPNSQAWRRPPGVPPMKCEAILLEQDGTYRVMQVLGASPCPETGTEVTALFGDKPRVSTWSMTDDKRRIRIDRTDVPTQIEEWEVFVVKTSFALGEVRFSAGDLVTYMRRDSRNEIGAATMFRHLQPLK